ncbi:YuiB-like putative membrane protein [Anoxybacillus vitaminiphilus]|uniref:YuiB-like putative membrane protein n=1 Tax=Paranoxybacillus vitaminiphilus TaxID=581036 RepID=A0A327YFQ8_9BACL|nr:YuiB family protein [Anoxybacillus vitaminiphilus]RAK18665.1 YuiB-like putative membrane protein [Anoxybacillus vitaminiphilus]
MEMSLPVLIISMLLFFVLFFGIGFLLNMLLRMSWIMAILSPIVFIFIIDDVKFIQYFTDPVTSFGALKERILSLAPADIMILSSGLFGAICAGIAIRALRAKGYQMF